MQRTFLELTHNPFAPPREGFFAGADRKTHLDQIRHLSRWSRRVLLVTGPFGIGKSVLFKELSSSLPTSAKGARVSGSLVTGERDVLLAVMQGLGIGVEQDMHLEDIIVLLVKDVEESAERGRMSVVMFDDAHLLAHTAVALLMRLVFESSLRIVLFAEPTLLRNINRSAKKHDVEWFEIRLTGFPEQDVRAYLEWRFAQAQYRGRLPFTDQQVKKIAERSNGNPNVIDCMANELLADLETGDVRDTGERFPRRHAMLVVVIGVLVFLVYQLYQQPIKSSVIANEPITEPQSVNLAKVLAAPPADAQPKVAVDEVMDEVMDSAQDSDSASEPAARADIGQPPPLAPDSELVVTSPDPGSMRPSLHREADGVDVQTAETEVEEARVEKAVPSEPVSASGTQGIVVVEAGFESSASTASLEIPAAINGPEWLSDQNSEHYTLQLMTLSRTQGGVDLILRQTNRDDFALYPLRRNGKTMYVLTYGVFVSEAAAQSAAANLSGELAGIQPWIRRLSAVQDSINN